ncbi:MAG TPA: hypothetical protein VGG03_23735 [Thermoanaerobaculia bacterium]
MKKIESSDTEWLQWIEIQKAVNKKWMRGALPSAVAEMDQFLAGDPSLDLRREALAFRAWLQRDIGDLKAAKSDLLAALALAEKSDFVRCELEESIGFICLQEGDVQEAENWYLIALRTAAADPRVAGGNLVWQFLKLRGERGVSEEERRLLEKVVRQSWALLRVGGEPDLRDLASTSQKLIEARKGPFSAERPPSPKAF